MPLTRSQIRTRSRRRAGCLQASRRVRLGLSLSRNPRLEPSRRTVTVTRAVGPPTGAASCRTPGPPGAGGSRAASEGPSLTVMSLRSLSAVSGPDPGRAAARRRSVRAPGRLARAAPLRVPRGGRGRPGGHRLGLGERAGGPTGTPRPPGGGNTHYHSLYSVKSVQLEGSSGPTRTTCTRAVSPG